MKKATKRSTSDLAVTTTQLKSNHLKEKDPTQKKNHIDLPDPNAVKSQTLPIGRNVTREKAKIQDMNRRSHRTLFAAPDIVIEAASDIDEDLWTSLEVIPADRSPR